VNLVFLGPPGSGKGTQAVKLAERTGMIHLSTGDILREAVKDKAELGSKAEIYMKKGELVPDDLMIELIENKVADGALHTGFILDGFPRTIPQAENLKAMFDKNEIILDKAVMFKVSDDEIIKRLSGRWYCPKCNTGYNYPSAVPKKEGYCDLDGEKLQRRPDDEEEVVIKRLDVYNQQTRPIEEFYKKESLLTVIIAEDTPDNVFLELLKAVHKD